MCRLVNVKGFLNCLILEHLYRKMTRNDVVRTAGVEGSAQFVVVRVGIERCEHGLGIRRYHKLIVAEQLNSLYCFCNSDSLSEQGQYSIVLEVYPQLLYTVLSWRSASDDRLARNENQRVNGTFDELLKLVKNLFVLQIPENHVAQFVWRSHQRLFVTKGNTKGWIFQFYAKNNFIFLEVEN